MVAVVNTISMNVRMEAYALTMVPALIILGRIAAIVLLDTMALNVKLTSMNVVKILPSVLTMEYAKTHWDLIFATVLKVTMEAIVNMT